MKVGIFHGGLQVGGWASNMLAIGNAIVTCKSVVSDQGCHWSLRTRAFKQGKLEIGDLISHVLSLLSSNDFGWFWWCLLVPNFNPQSNLCHPRQDAKSGGALLAKPVQGSLMGIRVVNSRDTEVGYPKKTSPLIAVTHPYHSQKITWDSTVPPASRLSTLDIDRPLVDYIIRWLPSHTSHLLLKWYPELNNPSQDWINRNLPLSLRGVSHHKPMNNPSKTQQKTYFSCWSSWTRHFSHIFSFFSWYSCTVSVENTLTEFMVDPPFTMTINIFLVEPTMIPMTLRSLRVFLRCLCTHGLALLRPLLWELK